MMDKYSIIQYSIGLVSILISLTLIIHDMNMVYHLEEENSPSGNTSFLLVNMYFVSWTIYFLLLLAGTLMMVKSRFSQLVFATLGFIMLMETFLNCIVYKVRVLNNVILVIMAVTAIAVLIICYFDEWLKSYTGFMKINNRETFIILLISGLVVYFPTFSLLLFY